MSDFDISQVIYKVLLLGILISAYLGLRGNPRKELRFALVWLIIIAVLVLGYSMLH